MKKLFTILFTLVMVTGYSQVTIYSENMGTPAANTFVNSYTGWQNSSPITYTSSTTPAQSDVRTSSASAGYTTASGGGNVFMGTTVGNYRDYIISGINTSLNSNVQLSFGMNTNSLLQSLTVEYSIDGGTNYLPVTFTNPTATGWSYINASTVLPSVSNLTIRFSKNNTGQFRIDDVLLTGNSSGAPGLAAGPDIVGLSTIVGTASVSQSYNLSGSNLTGFPGNITVTAPTGFEVSLSSSTGFATSVTVPYTSATLASTLIYVRIAASALAGAVSGIVTNTGGGATTATVNVSGNVLVAEPTIQASNIVTSNVTNSGFDINWTNGNGTSRIVIVRQTSTTQILPADGTEYTIPGSTGSGNTIVYVGTGTGPVTVTGLTAGTNYTIQVYEYNGTGGSVNYLTATATGNPVTVTTTGVSPNLQQVNFVTSTAPLYGASGSSTRLPVMFYATISSLMPNTTYRYFTQASISTDFGGTSLGAGNSVLIDYTVTPATYSYSAGGSLTSAGNYGKFTTDASGNFSGSFGYVNTGNSRFAPGSIIYPAIALGNDAGTVIEYRFALNQGITCLSFGTTTSATEGSFIQSIGTMATPGNIVGLWKSVDGTSLVSARPLSMTLVENPTFGGTATWAASFVTGYDLTAGSWNTIIPNVNPNGVRLIQQFNFVTGAVVGCASDADGTWPTGPVVTVNPTNGTTPLQISPLDAPLNNGTCFAIIPVNLLSFNAQKTGSQARIIWVTAQEINTQEFVIERSADNVNWNAIGSVPATGNSTSERTYSFIDNLPSKGLNYYRLRIVDNNSRFSNSEIRSLLFSNKGAILIAPNPASRFMNIYMDKALTDVAQIIITDINGRVMAQVNTMDQTKIIDVSGYAKGMYFVKIFSDNNTTIQKVIVN